MSTRGQATNRARGAAQGVGRPEMGSPPPSSAKTAAKTPEERAAGIEAAMARRADRIAATAARAKTDAQRASVERQRATQEKDAARLAKLRDRIADLGPVGRGGGRRAVSPFISERGVAGWTRGNAPGVPRIGYHYGTPEHVARLAQRGIDVTRNLHGTLGRGFYLFPRPGAALNPNTGRPVFEGEPVRVAIRMRNPFVGDMARYNREIAMPVYEAHLPSRGRALMDELTDRARALGYDGLVVSGIRDGLQGPNSTYVVAFERGSVRVIRPRA